MRANILFQNTLGLNLFTSDQCEELHLASLEVLDSVGVKVHEKEALDLLHSAGARIDTNLVRIPAWMVQEALTTAPCRIPIGNRQGERVMLLEKGRIYFGTGSDTQTTFDIYNGSRRATEKQDVINAA
ncbi:MAG: trimethylamine methyltransferase family protein, partial [candidate division Zixibacteria bacterium]|nr:trimethylamine methyltransferase family protein [candidate division Zixibacteria bacterium]